MFVENIVWIFKLIVASLPAQVGEFAVVVSTSSRDCQLCLAILNLWVEHRSYKVYSPLDVVAISVEASAAPTKNVFKPVRENIIVCLSQSIE